MTATSIVPGRVASDFKFLSSGIQGDDVADIEKLLLFLKLPESAGSSLNRRTGTAASHQLPTSFPPASFPPALGHGVALHTTL